MFGQHTAQDVSTIVKAADRELAGLGRGYTALNSSHEMPAGWKQAWERDYVNLRTGYSDARRPAMALVSHYRDMPQVDLGVVPAEAEYAGIKKALGGYRGLRDRLALAGVGTSNFGADPASFPVTATVTTSDVGAAGRLNVRSSPSSATNTNVIGQFEHLQKITITGPSVSGFYPVSGGGLVGYGSTSKITADPSAASPGVPFVSTPGDPAIPAASAPAGSLAQVTTHDTGSAGRLAVHLQPSKSSATVGTFEHLQMVTITGPVVAGHYPVSGLGTGNKNLAGFASAQFITPIAVAPPQPAPVAVTPQAAPPAPKAVEPNLGLPKPTPRALQGLSKLPSVKPALAKIKAEEEGHPGIFVALLLAIFGGGGYYLYRRHKKSKNHTIQAPTFPVASKEVTPA